MRARTACLADAFDRVSDGCILVEATGHLLHANAAAERILSRGSPLRVVGGRVRPSSSLDREAWARLLHRLGRRDAPAGDAIGLGTGSGCRLDVISAPLGTEQAERLGLIAAVAAPAGLLLMRDPNVRSPCPSELLVRLFDMTCAEAALAAALAGGQTLSGYAERTERSLNTVKTHLKAVFAKTGTSRQAEVVRLVADLSRLSAGRYGADSRS